MIQRHAAVGGPGAIDYADGSPAPAHGTGAFASGWMLRTDAAPLWVPSAGDVITLFCTRHGASREQLASELEIPSEMLDAERRPEAAWLRMALFGVGIARGEDPAALAWLLTRGPAGRNSPSRER